MFVPTEGIGACVARIVKECGLNPSSIEFTEEKCIVEFGGSKGTQGIKAPKEQHGELPESGWTKEGHRWRNGKLLMTVPEISEAIGVPVHALRQRLYANGRISTKIVRSKFDKISKRKRVCAN